MAAHADFRLHPGMGLSKPVFTIPNLILHLPSSRCVDPVVGVVYGGAGTPVGAACPKGYVRIGMTRDGHQYAHRLIYEAVHGLIPAGMEIDHRNGNKADNRIRNLDAVTHFENCIRALRRGQSTFGVARVNARLTDQLVREIRQTRKTVSCTEWAKRLGVDRKTIVLARDGTTWRHVPLRGPLPKTPRWRSKRPTSKR